MVSFLLCIVKNKNKDEDRLQAYKEYKISINSTW